MVEFSDFLSLLLHFFRKINLDLELDIFTSSVLRCKLILLFSFEI